MKFLLKNGTVVSGEGCRQEDVLIDGEKIVKVGRNLEAEGAEILDAAGKLLFPGFIDGHTHFDLEVAGTVTADDFETGTRAALLGGTTFVIDYASQDKGGHTLKEGLKKWHDKADGKCFCDFIQRTALQKLENCLFPLFVAQHEAGVATADHQHLINDFKQDRSCEISIQCQTTADTGQNRIYNRL